MCVSQFACNWSNLPLDSSGSWRNQSFACMKAYVGPGNLWIESDPLHAFMFAMLLIWLDLLACDCCSQHVQFRNTLSQKLEHQSDKTAYDTDDSSFTKHMVGKPSYVSYRTGMKQPRHPCRQLHASSHCSSCVFCTIQPPSCWFSSKSDPNKPQKRTQPVLLAKWLGEVNLPKNMSTVQHSWARLKSNVVSHIRGTPSLGL